MKTGGDFFNFISFTNMFVSKEIAGMGESLTEQYQPTQIKSWAVLLGELQNIKVVSHTWLTERRNLVRGWTSEELIRAHTALRTKIAIQWSISHADKILLEAMEKEWTDAWGVHWGKIQISNGLNISHGQWLSTTNSQWDTVAWWTKISVWKVLQ